MIIEDSVYHEFLHRLCERAKKIKIGPGIDPQQKWVLVNDKQLPELWTISRSVKEKEHV
ncbi:MAG: hypothetical protein R3C24_03300 [Cyanobacteriota/Melainabacteria group bacterium]